MRRIVRAAGLDPDEEVIFPWRITSPILAHRNDWELARLICPNRDTDVSVRLGRIWSDLEVVEFDAGIIRVVFMDAVFDYILWKKEAPRGRDVQRLSATRARCGRGAGAAGALTRSWAPRPAI